MQNFQPKLTKVGSQLSFSTGCYIVTDSYSGFTFSYNGQTVDVSAANITVEQDLFVKGNKTVLDSNSVSIKSPILYLNSVGGSSYGGLVIAESTGTVSDFIISGLNTNTVTFTSQSRLFGIVKKLLLENSNSYTFTLDNYSTFADIYSSLVNNSQFTQNFSASYTDTTLTISAANGIITSALLSGITGPSIKYTNGWQFDEGLKISNGDITYNGNINIEGNELTLNFTDIQAPSNYTVPNENSLVTKKWISQQNSANTGFVAGGVKLEGGVINIPVSSTTLNNQTFILPSFIIDTDASITIFSIVNSSTPILTVQKTQGRDFIDVLFDGNIIYSKPYTLEEIVNLCIEFDSRIYIYDNGLYAGGTEIVTAPTFNLLTLFDLGSSNIYVSSTFTWASSIVDNVLRGYLQKTFMWVPNLQLNATFIRKYDNTRIPDTTSNYTISTTGNIINMNPDLDTVITY